MLGMGWPELAVILIVAVFVFGPDKLPQLAKQAGSFLRTARQMMDNAKNDLAGELGDEYAALKDMNLRDLNPKEFVRRQVIEAMESDDEDDEPRPRRRRPDKSDGSDESDGSGDGSATPREPAAPPPYDLDAT